MIELDKQVFVQIINVNVIFKLPKAEPCVILKLDLLLKVFRSQSFKAHRIMSLLNKLTNTFKTEGLQGLLQKLFKKLIYHCESIVYLKYELGQPRKEFKRSSRWQIKDLTPDDIPLCTDHFKPYFNDYEDLFKEGFKAFGGFTTNANRVAGVLWYAPTDFYDQHYYRYMFKVAPHQVFQFAGEIDPDYRNTQISVNGMYTAWDYWFSKGKKEVICIVDTENSASLRLLFRLNWQEMGEIVHFHRLMGIKWQTVEHYEGERFQQYHHRRHKLKAKTG
ncbi:MAG: hypothetical protein CSA49_06400 [Gammaproteobacteria bacterium]|nr:MAG: hypothetical protein CSA49_06400 [Gammaproteobacteria bacterium]